MKNIKLMVIVFGLLWGPFTIQSQEYTINPKKSTLIWTGKAAFNSYSLTGTIKSSKGILTVNNTRIEGLQITIDMKSLDHENQDLKKHLTSEDFFEIKAYPKAEFSLKKPGILDNNKTILTGDLTIKSITNLEKIPITIIQKETEIIITFESNIDRTKYGINHNSPSVFKRLKENAIADEFILKGKLVFEL